MYLRPLMTFEKTSLFLSLILMRSMLVSRLCSGMLRKQSRIGQTIATDRPFGLLLCA